MARNLGINIKIGADLKQFSTDMQNVQRQMKRQARKMKQTGQAMTRSLTLPMALIGGASVKLAADFEQSMAKVRAVSGATGEEFKKLNDNALELGRTTRFTAGEVAELQLNLSKLGFNPKEITDSTAAILNLALASGEDLAQSATVAAGTMRGFGIATAESGRVADVMAKSFSSSGLDLEKFSVSMSKIAPVAKAAGFSFEQTTAMMSALADANVEASTIGTSLRQIFIELASKGISYSDAMEQIRNSTNKTVTATDLFDKRAAAAAIILAENETKVNDLSQSYLNAGGSAAEMAKIMDDTLQGSFMRLKSALEGAAIQIGDHLKPIIESLASTVTSLASSFSNLNPTVQKVIIGVSALVAVTGPLLMGFGSLIKMVSSSKVAILAFGRSISFLVNPITAVVAILGTLGIMLYKHIKSKEKLSAVSKDVTTNIYAEKTAMNAMFTSLKHTKEGTDARRRAIETLNTRYGEYLPYQLTEKSNLDDIANAQSIANQQLLKNIVLKSKSIDIEKANAKFIENTKSAMSDLAKESGKAKTKRSGFTKVVSDDQAKAFEMGVVGIIEKFKDTSTQEKYNESLKKIRTEINSLQGEMGIAITRTRQFDNAVLGLVNADVDRKNAMIEINTEYDKMSKMLGVVIDKTKQASNSDVSVLDSIVGDSDGGGIVSTIVSMDAVGLSTKKWAKSLQKVKDEIKELKPELKSIEPVIDSVGKYAEMMAERWQSTMESMKQGLEGLITDTIADFFSTLGSMFAGGENDMKGFGKRFLSAFGGFLGDFGKMLIAFGVAKLALFKSLSAGPAGAVTAIAAGAALVAIGGAISTLMKDSEDGFNTSGSIPTYSQPTSGGGTFGYGNTSDVLTLETVVYGRDIVLSSNRQHGTISRTRRK